MSLTPLMQQYVDLKAKNPAALLFFRCGDFYELFFDDAKEAASRLGIALTGRGGVPMAGVPWTSLEGYLKKLLDQGCRVAVAEQLTDPKLSKGLVERGVVEVVTPGTVTSESMLDERRPTFILSIARPGRDRLGLAWLEVSTGRLFAADAREEDLRDEVARIDPREVLLPDGDRGDELLAAHPGLPHPVRFAAYAFDAKDGRRTLCEHLGVRTLEGFGCEGLGAALGAAGALVRYIRDVKQDHLKAIRGIEPFLRETTLILDPATRRALVLVETARSRERKGTLVHAIDRTKTAMGARLLRAFVQAPLRDLAAIRARHDAVGSLATDARRLDALRAALEGSQDLERLTAKIAAQRATPRDLGALRAILERVPEVRAALLDSPAALLGSLAQALAPLPTLLARLRRELVDEPPPLPNEGGIVRPGVSAELDELHLLMTEGKGFLARFQREEIERTGIPSLKVGHNSVFGYYIEITNTHRDKVPDGYIRKQTLKGAERYITPELKDHEEKVTTARERADRLEQELFLDLRRAAEAEAARLFETAQALALADVLGSFAALAKERAYVRPEMEASERLWIVEGRHPVIEQTLAGGAFVPNDVELGCARPEEAAGDPAVEPSQPGARIAIVTGPNMAGKSTFCRQTALIALLAQTGSFVPARRAVLGVADRIFARLGTADDIASGLSTFMVEMTETANILRYATDKSLVILDEVGRGTSTYDGVSLAFAITRHLAEKARARTLFATHYHELTELARDLPSVKNLTVDVKEWGDEIVFLHKIKDGAADRSYGLHVARLAGVPAEVVSAAEEILAKLEAPRASLAPPSAPGKRRREPRQLSLFDPPEVRLTAELRALDVNALTPLKALAWLGEWKERLLAGDGAAS